MQNRELNKTQPGPPRASVKWWSQAYILITEIRLRYQAPWRTWSNTWEFGREKCAAWLKATERLLKGDGSPVGPLRTVRILTQPGWRVWGGWTWPKEQREGLGRAKEGCQGHTPSTQMAGAACGGCLGPRKASGGAVRAPSCTDNEPLRFRRRQMRLDLWFKRQLMEIWIMFLKSIFLRENFAKISYQDNNSFSLSQLPWTLLPSPCFKSLSLKSSALFSKSRPPTAHSVRTLGALSGVTSVCPAASWGPRAKPGVSWGLTRKPRTEEQLLISYKYTWP